MDNNESVNNVIEDTLKNFSYLADAGTVVGAPIITASGVTIIPVSKMTVAFLSGGGEYGEVKLFQKMKDYPLSTGSGGVVTVKPCGFLIESKGKTKYLSCPKDYFELAVDEVAKLLGDNNENN